MTKTIVITGPSAVGKSFLAAYLEKKYPLKIHRVKIYTSRKSRTVEADSDRIFITKEAFNQKLVANEFKVHGSFGGNNYGYTPEMLKPKDNKNIIVNVWPEIIPQFKSVPNLLIIALQTSKTKIPMLESRMSKRGDDVDTIKNRLKLIQNDIDTIEKHKSIIDKHGHTFNITSDQNLFDEVIPFLEKQLGL